jgi:hypothetical protein
LAAWTARIESIVAGPSATLVVAVDYFAATDTVFATPLASNTFPFQAAAPLAEARKAIIDWGQAQRAFLDRVATASANWSGATVNIP